METQDIVALSSAQLAGLSATNLRALTSDQILALETKQLSHLVSGSVAALKSTQISTLTSDRLIVLGTSNLAALTSGQVGTLTISTLAALGSANLNALNTRAMTGLTTQQVAGLSTTQVGNLSSSALNALTATQMGALETQDIAALSTSQLTSLSARNLSALGNSQVASLSTAQVAGLDSTTLNRLTSTQVMALETRDVAVLSSAQLAGLSTTNLRALSTNQVTALTTASIAALTTAGMAALTDKQLSALQINQLAALSTTSIQGITTLQAKTLTTNLLHALSTAQAASLTSSTLAALTTAQVASLSAAGMAALTAAQVATLKATSLRNLTTAGVATLLASPIVLDLNGDGVRTLGISAGVQFDLLASGNSVRSGWASPEDGLLALDRNRDGVINDGSELFGTSTALADGSKAPDGYVALRELDSNQDSAISSADAAFADLRVWVDANGDGASGAGELKSLDALGITRIELQSAAGTDTDNGNLLGLVSSYETSDGATHAAADVWFAVDPSGQTPLTDLEATTAALDSKVSGMAQAIGLFENTATQKSASGSDLGLSDSIDPSAGVTIANMVDAMKRFDASGSLIGVGGNAGYPQDTTSMAREQIVLHAGTDLLAKPDKYLQAHTPTLVMPK